MSEPVLESAAAAAAAPAPAPEPALAPASVAAVAPAPVPAAGRMDYRKLFTTMETPRLISEYWETAEDAKVRDRIVTALVERGEAAWPSAPMAAREEMGGLYPDPADPQFPARLFAKREFYEARAVAAGVAEGTIDPCTSAAAEKVFELTPVQRIVSRFLHPLTPYNGMLLFHGVGVGKTCSAVTIAEQFLESAPTTKVIVLAPQALQENFKRTVVDPSKFVWDERARQWQSRQCTGTSYLERLGLLDNPDLKHVQYKVEEDRRLRYTVTGYQAFANWIRRTLDKSVPEGLTDPALRERAENEVLRRLFSDHLIIVDEAHNMRDTSGPGGGAGAAATEAAAVATAGEGEAAAAGEAAENAGGKALNPYLKRIVLNAEGLRLVLMTATPMYNSAPEITLLLNFLIMNDTKSEKSQLSREVLFTGDGALKADSPAVRVLERVARRYVSYMRGENPYTFPLRIRPAVASPAPAEEWPALSAARRPVDIEPVHDALNAMPLVFTEPVPGSVPERLLRGATRGAAAATAAEGGEGAEAEAVAAPVLTDSMLDFRMQMANMTYPNEMYGTAGWEEYFAMQVITEGDRRDSRKMRFFSAKPQDGEPFNVDTLFTGEGLRSHAPKIHRIIESVKAAQGICFVYSRYIKAGALPLAIALERAGFQRRLADGRLSPLLVGQTPVAPICALCGRRRGGDHEGQAHPFKPATYVLLTSEADISPNFAGLVRQAAQWPDEPEYGPLGANVKVVIGSQVASEGLDLKCIREMHILDAWYHLNRTDQIIGRAIRYCSHSALRAIEERSGLPAMSMNNCLIYLHALRVPETELGPAFETADMYAYRIAIRKAMLVGEVQRLLKKHAWDCNLELEAITFAGLPPRSQIDAQGRRFFGEEGGLAKYSIDDVDFTTYCDYQRCAHECAVAVARSVEEGLRLDASTYSTTDARRQITRLQDAVRRLFDGQVMVPETVVQGIFSDLPWEIASEALMELIDGRRFRLRRPDGVEGFLIKKAGWLVFQPAAIHDTDIPMTLRYARAFQLRRKFLSPHLPVFARTEEPALAPAPAPAAGAPPPSAAAAAAAPALMPAAAAAPIGELDAALVSWGEWFRYVISRGEAPVPRWLPSTLIIWRWLLQRYAALPQTPLVAMRWWFDRLPYNEQRALYEFVLMRPVSADAEDETELPLIALGDTLRADIFRSAQIVGYRVYNPDPAVMAVETWCRPTTAAATARFTPCSSAIGPIINKQLGNAPVPIPAGVGALFGFLAPKTGRMVFKTLDTTKAVGKHKVGGAECGNTSNLGEHRPRIRLLQEAGRSVEALAPLMLPDREEEYGGGGGGGGAGAAAAKKRTDAASAPAHLNDITHQPLCLYMEFLCRILDASKVQGRRWFLTAVDAAHSGLKGKK